MSNYLKELNTDLRKKRVMFEDELKTISFTEKENTDVIMQCQKQFDNEISQVKIICK